MVNARHVGERVHYCRRNGEPVGEGTICSIDSDVFEGARRSVYHIRIETPDGKQFVLWGYDNQIKPVQHTNGARPDYRPVLSSRGGI